MKLKVCFLLYSWLVISHVISAEKVKKLNGSDKIDNNKNVSKRGIHHYGGGFGLPSANYGSYFGLKTPYTAPSPFLSGFPLGGIKSPHLFGGQTPFVVSPGGAVVSSYNVNYPQYPYYGVKSFNQFPIPAAGNNILNNIGPSLVPRTPVAYHPYNPIHTVGSIPRPFVNFAPVAAPSRPAFAAIPFPAGIAPNFPAHGVIPFGFVGSNSHLIPTSSQFIPNSSHLIPTTLSTPTPASPALVPAGQPWRPVFVNPPATISTPSVVHQSPVHQPPPISLLPPYHTTPVKETPESVQIPQNSYLSPSNLANLLQLQQQQQQQQQQQEQNNQQQFELAQAHQQQQQNHQQFEGHQSEVFAGQNSNLSNEHRQYLAPSNYESQHLQENRQYQYRR